MTAATAALVLFSGGQDSTTCLAWALDKFSYVETIGFDYGQRHRVELSCREIIREHIAERFPLWAQRLGIDHALAIPVLSEISDTALTSPAEIKLLESGLPNTFVPGRNLLFLTIAAAVAYRRAIQVIVGGMCETDFSGYPDCRRHTIDAMEGALNLGMAAEFHIETPLMRLTKAGTWQLAERLGGSDLVDLIVAHTHTCYLGERGEMHPWGYGCGCCPACELRAGGHKQWLEST
jgi:7-cyano-7-deazaguanine synthase